MGPIIACYPIGYSGDIGRFRDRDHFAAYDGTDPIELSSGGRTVHRLSQRGNRRLNHAIHLAAICQIRQTSSAGRTYFDRKFAEGKTKKEALRALKRHLSNAVYRQLVIDAQPAGQERAREDKRERLCGQRDRPYLADGQLFGEVTPGPTTTLGNRVTGGSPHRPRPATRRGP